MNAPQHPTAHRTRIDYIDGLRGFAILMVVLFHAYPRWPELMPFGALYAETPLKYGYLGVQLFFLISGFVIFMTLDKSASAFDFLRKRFIRLFPAMLIVTVFVYLTAGFFHERPAGIPQLLDTIPGLLFLEPNLVSKILGVSVKSIEASFWSLYVEVKFYFFCAAVYFFLKRKYLVFALLLAYLVGEFLANAASLGMPELEPIKKMVDLLLSAHFYAWFFGGAMCYLAFCENNNTVKKFSYYAVSFLVVSISIFAEQREAGHVLVALFVLVLFHASFLFEFIQQFLRSKVLLFIGSISYPFYLIHENMLVSISIKMAQFFPSMPPYLIPIPGIVAAGALAYMVAQFLEPPVQKLLRRV